MRQDETYCSIISLPRHEYRDILYIEALVVSLIHIILQWKGREGRRDGVGRRDDVWEEGWCGEERRMDGMGRRYFSAGKMESVRRGMV